MAIDDALFYGVCLSQLVIISLYGPSKIVRRARGLIGAYPAAEFPKLYPVPTATIDRALRVYRNLNLGVLVLGLALLAADAVAGYTIERAWQNWQEGDAYPPVRIFHPAALLYAFLQSLPTLLFVYCESLYFKRMRAAARGNIRTAELKARRVLDFVPRALFGTAAAMYVGVTASLLVLALPKGLSALMIAALTICNMAAAVILIWLLHAKRHDPYQTHEDRSRLLRYGWRQLLVASVLLSACYGISGALIAFGLHDYVLLVGSLSIQAAAVLSTGKAGLVVLFGQASFDVYRPGTHPEGAVAANK